MKTDLNAIAFKAQTQPKYRFQNLFGTLDTDALYRGWASLNKRSAAGIDGVTANDYQLRLSENIHLLHQKLKTNRYRADDVKRVYIPKANGKERPLGHPQLQISWFNNMLPKYCKVFGNKTLYKTVMATVHRKVHIKPYTVYS